MDAEAALDYLVLRRDVCDPETIFLFGRSLGGAVAMELAGRREGRVRGIIVEVGPVAGLRCDRFALL